MKKMTILIYGLLFLTSCSKKLKNCNLIGEWKSIKFTSDKPVDMDNDGVFNINLLKEDSCTEIIYNFKNNGKVENFHKNKRTNCQFKKSTLNYVIDGKYILFTVSGMKQKHPFDITDCKLHIYGVYGVGKTAQGKQRISINSTFKKK